MKLIAKKELQNGVYTVTLVVSELTSEEKDKIIKFGSPSISIQPKSTAFRAQWVDKLPLHEINHSFTFTTEPAASSFLENMRLRIANAVQVLRAKRDDFSKEEEYEL